MSSFLCFICHNTVNSDTTEETREKYREVIGINLCPDSHLCYICCHMVNKLWLFRAVCFKRSLEYPVLFSEKCTLNLHRSEIETLILCTEDTCLPTSATHLYFRHTNENKDHSNDYVELEDERTDTDQRNEIECYRDSVGYQEILERPYSVDNVTTESVDNDATIRECDDDFDVDNESDGNNICDDEVKFEDNVKIDDGNCDEIGDEELDTSKDPTSTKTTFDFDKITLSIEDQKAELEAHRRSKKYTEAEFKCYNCALGFLFKDSYQAHMMRHEESNGEYVCALCTLRFACSSVLRAHRAAHAHRAVCSRCGARVRERQRHTHARACHGARGDSAACHLCGNVFQDASGLQQHLKRFHMSKTSNRTYSCNVCGKSYNNQAAVRQHMIKHIQRKFTCDQCASSFSSPYTLTQHKKKHTNSSNEKSHVCATCGVGYTSRKSLLAHMRTAVQHQNTVFECPICNRVCPNSAALSQHISRVHSTTKDFHCSRCEHKYTTRKGLIRHMKEHTTRDKTKMAQCHICGKSFKTNSKLNRHLREVCRKDKLEEELSAYHEQPHNIL